MRYVGTLQTTDVSTLSYEKVKLRNFLNTVGTHVAYIGFTFI